MEDTLEVYTCPRDPARPVICLDETSSAIDKEKRFAFTTAARVARRSTTSMARRCQRVHALCTAGRSAMSARKRRTLPADYVRSTRNWSTCISLWPRRSFLLTISTPTSLIVQGIPTLEALRIAERIRLMRLYPKAWVLAQYVPECEAYSPNNVIARRIPDFADMNWLTRSVYR